MRKVVVYTLMALDGAVDQPARYFGPADTYGGPPEFDEVMDAGEADVVAMQDAVLLGRRLYDEWSAYWPTVPEQRQAVGAGG